jgi:hypothetical protein
LSPSSSRASEAGIGNQSQEIHVLDQREARADGEAEDRRVDEEADAMGVDQRDDDERLHEFLDDGRDVAGVLKEVDLDETEDRGIEKIAHAGGDGAADDDRDDPAELHQLVAVEIKQRGEKAHHGHDAH